MPKQLTALNTTLNGNHATINAPLIINSTARMNGNTTIVGDLKVGGNQRLALGTANFGSGSTQILSIGQNTTTTYGNMGLLVGNKNYVSGSTGANFILAGSDNRMFADNKNAYCYVLGTANTASAVGAFIFGSNNQISGGEYSVTMGVGNQNYGTASLVVGDNNTNNTTGALVTGTRNKNVADGLFIVGNGYQDTSGTTVRQNIMEVTRTGFKVDTNNTNYDGITLKAGTSTNTSAPINLEGGSVSIKSRSGGIMLNAIASTSSSIYLNGGKVKLTSSGEGIELISSNSSSPININANNSTAKILSSNASISVSGSSGKGIDIKTNLSTHPLNINGAGDIKISSSSSSNSVMIGSPSLYITSDASPTGDYVQGLRVSSSKVTLFNKNSSGDLEIGNASSGSLKLTTIGGSLDLMSGGSLNLAGSNINIGKDDGSGGYITIPNLGEVKIKLWADGFNVGRDNDSTSSRGFILMGHHLTAIPLLDADFNKQSGNIVFGNYNKKDITYTDLLVVGNGQNIGDTENGNNALRLTTDGYLYYSTGCGEGADYAEFYEWSDGNPDAEDRIGVFVTFDFDKEYNYTTAQELPQIKIAQPGEYIVGVISGNPAFVGNSDEDWKKRWLYDEFDRPIIELIEVPVTELKEVETGEYYTEIEYNGNDEEVEVQKPVVELKEVETGEMRTQYVQVLNPDYDPSLTYKSRFDRPEWDTACMLGNISMKDDGTCLVGHYCKCGVDGVATYASERDFDTFLVTRRISDNIIKIIYK